MRLTDDSKHRRWGLIALALSLVLNLFLIAVIGGHWLGMRRAGTSTCAAMDVEASLARFESELSPNDAAAFRSVLRRDAPRYTQSMQQLAEARKALRQQILAEPFNEATASQALATWQTDLNQFMNDFRGPFMDAVAEISPEGRRRLVPARPIGP